MYRISNDHCAKVIKWNFFPVLERGAKNIYRMNRVRSEDTQDLFFSFNLFIDLVFMSFTCESVMFSSSALQPTINTLSVYKSRSSIPNIILFIYFTVCAPQTSWKRKPDIGQILQMSECRSNKLTQFMEECYGTSERQCHQSKQKQPHTIQNAAHTHAHWNNKCYARTLQTTHYFLSLPRSNLIPMRCSLCAAAATEL